MHCKSNLRNLRYLQRVHFTVEREAMRYFRTVVFLKPLLDPLIRLIQNKQQVTGVWRRNSCTLSHMGQ